jgi:hypothetical protein
MRFVVLIFMLFMSENAAARDGLSLDVSAMALTNATKQGGRGAEGSTVLTQSDFDWHDGWYAAGVFVQYDKQGSAETDIAAGPRLEATFDPFFVELGYAVSMTRSFTDRAIADQKGKAYVLGLGARFGIAGGNDNDGPFLQFSYKYRVQTISSQDGKALDQSVTQTDGYPLFGLGLGF